jgi:WD40 repeat protein
MAVCHGRSPAVVAAIGALWMAAAGCGSRLSTNPGQLATGPKSHPPSGDAATGGGDDAATRVDASRASGGRADAATVDASGPALSPYPPATCADTGWTPAVPGHAAVQGCAGQVQMSSRLTMNGASAPRFIRCGALGPEIETDVRLSPDGARLATLTGAGTVRLFATDDWHEIAQLAPAAGRMDAFAFSPDGTRLATLSMEPGDLTVWSAADATPQARFMGRGTAGGLPVTNPALAFSRDGRRIASSLGTIVNIGDGTALTVSGLGGVDQMAFTMCDAKLYVRYRSRTGDSNESTDVALYDSQTGKAQWLFGAWDSFFGGSALSQDGRLVAVSNGYHPDGSPGFDLWIYRGDTGDLVDHRADWTAGSIQAFTPDDTGLLVVNNGQLDQWRIADGAVVTATAFGTGARLLGFPGPDTIAIGSPSGTASWSLSEKYSTTWSLRFSVTAASWTADGAMGAGIADDGLLFHVWREPDATEVCTPAAPGPTAAATSFGLSGDGRTLAIGKADGVVDLYDTAAGSRRSAIETAHGPVATVALSWDGTLAAAQTSASDAPVQLWSAATAALQLSVPLPVSMYSSTPFAISPDAQTIAANAGGTVVTLINVTTGKVQSVQPVHSWASGGTLSPDGAHLAGWADAPATWRLADAVRDDVLIAPADLTPVDPDTTPSIALASDWSLAAATNGPAVVVWDPRSGTEISKITGLANDQNGVLGVAGGTVAVNEYLEHTFGGEYYVVHLYDVSSGAELRVFDAAGAAPPLLLGADGTRAYTLEPPDVITWCRW